MALPPELTARSMAVPPATIVESGGGSRVTAAFDDLRAAPGK
jgi:hypothetical protein